MAVNYRAKNIYNIGLKLEVTDTNKTITYITLGACTIKHYGFVIYGKWADFVVA